MPTSVIITMILGMGLVMLLLVYGYALNILKFLRNMTAIRLVGIFIPIIGAIIGWF